MFQHRDNGKLCRQCRAGAGKESKRMNGKTEGFPLISENKLETDFRGFKKLAMKRSSSRRMRQTSMSMTQSWRANTDIQILLHSTNPEKPDPMELSNIIDYCISYITKTSTALEIEKVFLTKMIQKYVSCIFPDSSNIK